jgi:dimethylhistidine N-methyltransferase
MHRPIDPSDPAAVHKWIGHQADRARAAETPPCFIDLTTAPDSFKTEVLRGLRAQPKSIPPKYFYDADGARLFEAICQLPEYYLTRTENALLAAQVEAIAAAIGEVNCVIEPGAGSCRKVRMLIEALRPALVCALDIAGTHLEQAAAALARDYPALQIKAIGLDFLNDLDALAPYLPTTGRRLIFYPGSSIGNFTPAEATALMRQFRALAKSNGALLIGFDLKKDPALLHQAYNDGAGITAAFNLNLLARLNRELDADFALDAFRHYAFYNPGPGRIEMHILSLKPQTVRVDGERFAFAAGETVHTENSYKYRPEEFARLAMDAGWQLAGEWQDPNAWFALQYYDAV